MPDTIGDRQRERLLRMLAMATFIIFFQAYMVAPIIPALSIALNASVQTAGLLVPAYLIPSGVAPLLYGLLADRVGIHLIIFFSFPAFVFLPLLTPTPPSS